ncbi:hypothetical protein Tco_1245598 [Tanacetum coccineum]
MKIEESLNVTFDETPPPSKTSPLVDYDLDEEEAIKVTEKNLENDIEDETLEIEDAVNIKESRKHPLENVIGNLNQRTLRSQAQNQSNFFCFISTIEPKNVNETLKDESWIIAMQDKLNQFIANDVRELVEQVIDQQRGHSIIMKLMPQLLGDLDNSTNNVLIPLDSWTSGLLVYRLPLSVEYGVSTSTGYGVSSSLSNTTYSSQQINTAYPLPLDTALALWKLNSQL